jgi:hypothetical protein
MVCLRNVCVNTLHKGDSIFTNNNNNNNNTKRRRRKKNRRRRKKSKNKVLVYPYASTF